MNGSIMVARCGSVRQQRKWLREFRDARIVQVAGRYWWIALLQIGQLSPRSLSLKIVPYVPDDSAKCLVLLGGAPEGIRTLDPNLLCPTPNFAANPSYGTVQ
jgi:hypothetical protein